jgi:hypothetical protein
MELVPAEPGSVKPFFIHALIKLARPEGAAASVTSGWWWPDLLERESAVIAVFRDLAQLKLQQKMPADLVTKITAYDDVGQAEESAPDAAYCDVMIFPHGVLVCTQMHAP